MEKNRFGSSLNKQEELLNFLKSDLPEVFSEGKVDCKKLKQTLGEEVDDGNERYGLSWAGKSNCFKVIQEQTTATLKLDKNESKNFNETQNLFIEGDNLEVLKVLQRSYYGKVKMIYIDPPYNTGNDFIYNDNFRKSKKEELEGVGDLDENGNLTRVDGLSINRKDSNGHFHSDWLNMIYPRLFLARNILRQDGVIFVSIDDNEVHNLRMIMNEIFGEENFIAQIEWQKRYTRSNNTDGFTSMIEHILVYARSSQFKPNLMERNKEADARYSNPDNDLRGVWKAMPFFSQATPAQRPNLCYKIVNPNTGESIVPKRKAWRSEKSVFEKYTSNNVVWWGKDGKAKYPSIKRFLSEAREGMTPINFWDYKFAGSTDTANFEIKAIFEEKIFDTPKPTLLIKRMLELSTNSDEDDIILDFFAGSGTTAHAVMMQNMLDEGNRKWICVQIPELCDENSEAYKAGYKTIAEIGKERIRRAGDKIEKDNKNKIDLILKFGKENLKIQKGY
ncbi:MAG: Type III restriction-modification system methyltransferase [Candidatus Moranbacteria bacterium GW2011_GWF2_35_54]|nr:MAG: Type III restriction-modification system methyltransferase [Candidatus Moranbacteria bacterium GW2011_GWF2_35_54]